MRNRRNITVTVSHETYRQIRAWCAQRDTCVSHVVQAFLKDLPRMEDVQRFPLPGAPDPRSLGAHLDRLKQKEIDLIRLEIGDLM